MSRSNKFEQMQDVVLFLFSSKMHIENSTNTSKWRVSEVGTAQSRREDTTGEYRNRPHTRCTIREPFFTSGYIILL